MEGIAFYIIFSTTHHDAPISKESTRADETVWSSLSQCHERIKIIIAFLGFKLTLNPQQITK